MPRSIMVLHGFCLEKLKQHGETSRSTIVASNSIFIPKTLSKNITKKSLLRSLCRAGLLCYLWCSQGPRGPHKDNNHVFFRYYPLEGLNALPICDPVSNAFESGQPPSCRSCRDLKNPCVILPHRAASTHSISKPFT